MNEITHWFKRTFSNPEVVAFSVLVLGLLFVVIYAGDILLPVIISVVVAYLLEGIVRRLVDNGVPRFSAVILVFIGFLLAMLVVVFGLLPYIWRQLLNFLEQLPTIVNKLIFSFSELQQRFPEILGGIPVQDVVRDLTTQATRFAQRMLGNSVSSVVSVITIVVYMVLVPFLIFFLLKDKDKIISWVSRFIPSSNSLAMRIWDDVDNQIGNYVRGKFWEIIIITIVSTVVLGLFSVDYFVLLGIASGFSVLIPFVGAAIISLLVMVVSYFEWGFHGPWIWVAMSFLLIHALDGYVLVPILFSEAVDLHPVAIMVSIILFGGIWGFWGVFFAIPLASLIKATLEAWPDYDSDVFIDSG